jgi:replicative DNA helicase
MYSCYTQLTNYTGDAVDVMNKMKDVITQVDLILNNASTDKSVKDIFDETLKRIMDLKNNVIENTGYSFGLTQVDAKTGGLMKGVNVIGALPGAGKTSLVVNIIKTNAIDSIVPTLFFSIEMPAVEIMTNIIANDTSINSRALRQGDVDDGAIMSINSMSSKIKNNLSIDDNGNVTWQYVEAKVRAFKKKNKVTPDKTSIVIIDYLQLMSNSADEIKGTTEEQRIAKICKELTRIAKSENCAIVLLSQLSRDGGKRENPRPKMSDLKGSGAIEACAILILLLFRPEYHGILTDEKGNDLTGLCEINPVKGRYIKPEPVYVRFEGKYSKFSDYTESPF